MKKAILLLTIFLALSFNGYSQDLPRVSQSASVEQKIGLTWVIVSYARPSVNNREIWGELVPYNQIWRTGANEPTLLILDDDVQVNGKKVTSGQYALFTIPKKNSITFILNSNSNQWGSFDYDPKFNVLEFDIKATQTYYQEYLTFAFKDSNSNTAMLCLSWAEKEYCFEIKTDPMKKALKNIEEAISFDGEKDYKVYLRAINYAIESGNYLDKAEDWATKAIELSDNAHDALWAKAMLYGVNKDYEKAMAYGKKGIDALMNEGKSKEVLKNYKENMETWKKLKK